MCCKQIILGIVALALLCYLTAEDGDALGLIWPAEFDSSANMDTLLLGNPLQTGPTNVAGGFD